MFHRPFLLPAQLQAECGSFRKCSIPSEGLVVTYRIVPADRMMCGVILPCHVPALHEQPALIVAPRKPQWLEALPLWLCQNEFLLSVSASDIHSWAMNLSFAVMWWLQRRKEVSPNECHPELTHKHFSGYQSLVATLG